MKSIDHILENDADVLAFLQTRYPLYHLSNVFFRDIQYGIQVMLERRGAKVGYSEAERFAREFVSRLEKKKILVPIDRQSWVLYYEEFKTKPAKSVPVARAAAPAKPAASAAAVPRPAGGLPPLKSSAPAAVVKPSGGLPPLKSSAPVAGKPDQAGTEPTPATVATETTSAETVQVAAPIPAPLLNQKVAEPTKPAAPGVKKPLPPIKSSVPAGSKK